ncbi:MFS transporter [Raoultella ornithinolytica]|uniref:MFS transporter n=1 Tax=Raoultella ornithinolytica TaxID=54291 RepID=UPI001C8DF5B4|nr:MFS transporter [Raoultella ornithinolytica]
MSLKIIDKPTIMALLVAAVFFMENLDATIITTSIPYMAHDFHVTPESLSVGISAYMISITVLLPISGWISDRFGANKIFPLGILIFTLSSILCALSVNLLTFTISRVLQGLGGAIMVPVGRLVVLRATDKDGVIKAIAILTWPALVAPILGPVLGGWISTFWGWRWIFLINIPFGVIAICMSLIYVVESKKEVERIDVQGFFLAGLGCCCVMAGIEMASRQNLPILISSFMLISGVVFLFMLYRHVKKYTKPIFSLSLLTYKTFRVTIVGGSLFRTAVNAAPFLVPLTFQIGFGWSAIEAGTMLLYLFAGNLLMKLFTTTLINRFGFKKILLLNGIGGGFVIYFWPF